MSRPKRKIFKKSIFERRILNEEEKSEEIKKFFFNLGHSEKRDILELMGYGDEVKGWNRKEVEANFTDNLDEVISKAFEDESIRNVIDVDNQTLNDLYSGENTLDELVDSDGNFISGDETYKTTSQVRTAPQQTTADYAASAIQPRRYFGGGFDGGGGTPYSHGSTVAVGESVEKEVPLEEKEKMKSIIEDILDKKNKEDDLVGKDVRYSDLNKNKIPDIEDLGGEKYDQYSVSTKTRDLVDSINKNELSGEEIAITLNFILNNINVEEVPANLRRILKRKI